MDFCMQKFRIGIFLCVFAGVTIDDEHIVLVNVQDTLIPLKSDGGDLELASVIHEPRPHRGGRPKGIWLRFLCFILR